MIRNGVLRMRDGVIEALGPAGEVEAAQEHRAIEYAAILPGLVNAHTHLELSHLRGLLPRRTSMPRWIMSLLRNRGPRKQRQIAVETGARELLATGTTTIADISHDNSSWPVLRRLPLRKLCFAEVVGISPDPQAAMARLEKTLQDLPPQDEWLRFGITPHAPYSVSENLYRQAITLAAQRGWPVCTHLAETRGERQFLMRGGGMFLKFLQTLGLVDETFAAPRCKPLELARRAGLLDTQAILAHVNYLDDDELALLAASRASVVYCPGSSAFFGRSDHRYPEMLAAGINVAVGTDSLASNDSLDMLAEMRRLRRQARVDNHTILRMATLNGARAMGWQDRIGSLAPGKSADWIAVQLPPSRDCPCFSDVLETLLTHPCKVLQTVIAGRTEYSAQKLSP